MRDQVVVITGASRGIGQAAAVTLARAGAKVVAVARSQAGLAETHAAVERAGALCRTVEADVTRFDVVQAMIDKVVGEFGRVDILVNNAGAAPLYKMAEYDIAAFEAMMLVNCNALFYACRAVWPIMAKQGGGRIVNISSVAAKDAFDGFQAYGASKAWVNALTEFLAKEGRPQNIQVYAVCPGAVDTTMLRQHFPDFPAEQCLSPQDIADAITWVLDARSTHASGAAVVVTKG